MVKDIVIVILGINTIAWIVFLDKLNKSSLGLLQLLAISLVAAILFFIVSKKKAYFCHFHFPLILAINGLVFFNTSSWNEGSMSGADCLIPMLQPASDLLYGMLLFFIPLILYGVFLYSVSQLFCKKKRKKEEVYFVVNENIRIKKTE